MGGGVSPRSSRRPGRRAARQDGRAAALTVLERVELAGGSSNALLAEIEIPDERERHLATTLVYGVLRRRRTLDRLIEKTSSRQLSEIDTRTLIVLRLALFQILFLTRVPRAASVNEAVSLLRARRGRGAAAFANGVLRTSCRLLEKSPDEALLLQEAPGDPVGFLSEKHSCPRFLVERYLERLGRQECEALLDTFNRPAPIVLRLRQGLSDAGPLRERLLEEGVETTPSPLLAGALRVVRGSPQRTQVFREGLIYIQDEAAQIVALLLLPIDPAAGFLDLCAAPGGKLLAVAEALPQDALVVAADAFAERLRIFEDNAMRARIGGILKVVMDAARPALRRSFGRVLLDAPCSGTGVIRRHPEIRWRRRPEDILRSAEKQAGALRAAADLVSPSGRLVYSVCSLEPEEGQQQVEGLLAARRDLVVVDARLLLPPSLHRLVDGSGFLQTLPHRDDTDGFFAAVLARR
jgi:16S rRNA (cytosine967-C5)-methyltransferase